MSEQIKQQDGAPSIETAKGAVKNVLRQQGVFATPKNDVPRDVGGKFTRTAPEGSSTSPAQPEQKAPESIAPDRREAGMRKALNTLQQERDRLRAEAAQYKQRLTELEGQQLHKEVLKAEKPDDWDGLDEEERSAWIATEAAKRATPKSEPALDDATKDMLRQIQLERELAEEHGDELTVRQLKLLAQIHDTTVGLSSEEALALARHRHPEAFASPEPPAKARSPRMPPGHQVLSPSTSTGSRAAADPVDAARAELVGSFGNTTSMRRAATQLMHARLQAQGVFGSPKKR